MTPTFWALTDYFASRNFSVTVLIVLVYSKMLKQINLSRVVPHDFSDNGTTYIKEGTKNLFIVQIDERGRVVGS